jgi:hypothetical protein
MFPWEERNPFTRSGLSAQGCMIKVPPRPADPVSVISEVNDFAQRPNDFWFAAFDGGSSVLGSDVSGRR